MWVMVAQFYEYTKNHRIFLKSEKAFMWEQSDQSFLFYFYIESNHLKTYFQNRNG